MDIKTINSELEGKSGIEIVKWAVEFSEGDIIVSTNFRPHEAVILHLATQVKPDIPVLWADSGYNTKATYRFAVKLIRDMNLNMKIYSPNTTAAYRDQVYGGIPDLDEPEIHDKFTEEVKLEPFKRGLADLKPKVWLTAIRKVQTEFRSSLGIASEGANGLLKISPVFDLTDEDMEKYLEENNLPDEKNYFDPTKVLSGRECGLHTSKS